MAFLQAEEEKEHSIEHVYFIISWEAICDMLQLVFTVWEQNNIYLFTNFEYIFKNLQFHFGSVLDSRQTLTFDLPKFKAKGL